MMKTTAGAVVVSFTLLLLALLSLSLICNGRIPEITVMTSIAPSTLSSSSSSHKNQEEENKNENGSCASTDIMGRQQQKQSNGNSNTSNNNKPNDKEKKIIYGIRHGTSESNEYMSIIGNRWGDNTFRDDIQLWRDSPLSDKGKQEAAYLSERLLLQLQSRDNWLHDIELVVVSPLARCLMTYEIGVKPALIELMSNNNNNNNNNRKIPVIVLPLITERVYTSADVGQTISHLQKTWKKNNEEILWDDALSNYGPDQAWWYHHEGSGGSSSSNNNKEVEEWRPHGEGQYYAVPGEPELVFENRMKRVDKWIFNVRPEKTILVIAHWGVLRHWTGGKEIKNGDICRVEYGGVNSYNNNMP